jgi:hypothetical protein
VKEHPYLTFGPTSDWVSLFTLALGVVALALALFASPRLRALFNRIPTRWFVGGLALVAALLSWFYLTHYLRGGPRIIDAAAYFLEGRVLSTGHFAFDVPEPSGSFRGRFLLPTPDGRLAVIFPPGYPLLLAVGFVLGAPLAVGPLLAALLVVATHFTTKTFFGDERAARLAAVLSTLSVTLRYHTADTMSHGFSALLVVLAVGAAAKRTRVSVVLAGLAAGLLVATRPMSGAVSVLLSVCAFGMRPALFLRFALGLVPGGVLLAAYQNAATGDFLGSTQLAYYALSDGPPGCFGLGFGPGIGCRFEHGDFVKEHLADGFWLAAAARVTVERLALHAIDIANFAPLALLVPWAAVRYRNEPAVRLLALAPLLIVLSYAPFYYPGSYPGAGARFYADVLPLEHALVALALVRTNLSRFAPAAALAGFSLHAVHEHEALAEREGGAPMFSPGALGSVKHGLVFVRTDHGFLLGFDPESRDPRRAIVVARERGDAHDRVLWEHLGRPPTYRYDYDVERGTTRVSPVRPDEAALRYEGESEWPPLAVPSGWAHPDFRSCLSRGQGLHLRADNGRTLRSNSDAIVEIELVAPTPGRYAVSVGWLADPRTPLTVIIAGKRHDLTSSRLGEPRVGACFAAQAFEADFSGPARARFDARGDLIIDYVELTPLETKKR